MPNTNCSVTQLVREARVRVEERHGLPGDDVGEQAAAGGDRAGLAAAVVAARARDDLGHHGTPTPNAIRKPKKPKPEPLRARPSRCRCTSAAPIVAAIADGGLLRA